MGSLDYLSIIVSENINERRRRFEVTLSMKYHHACVTQVDCLMLVVMATDEQSTDKRFLLDFWLKRITIYQKKVQWNITNISTNRRRKRAGSKHLSCLLSKLPFGNASGVINISFIKAHNNWMKLFLFSLYSVALVRSKSHMNE